MILADAFGVDHTTIYKICRGVTRKSAGGPLTTRAGLCAPPDKQMTQEHIAHRDELVRVTG